MLLEVTIVPCDTAAAPSRASALHRARASGTLMPFQRLRVDPDEILAFKPSNNFNAQRSDVN